jgi:hypothetical protein
MDSLSNDEDTGAGSIDISRARFGATARAVPHVPNRRVTTLAAGHSPLTKARQRVSPTPTRVRA